MSILVEKTLNEITYAGGIYSEKPISTTGAITGGTITSTGALTATGGLIGGTQAITGSGAINLTTLVTKLNSTGGGAYTLANGTDGQVKVIVLTVDGGDATITPTTATGFTTITFDAIGDGVTLVYTTTTGWICVGNNGGALA
jgi:hypothetical protein